MEKIITILALLAGLLLAVAGVIHHSFIAAFMSLFIFAQGCIRALNDCDFNN
jgi:hypothetical protein